MDDIGDQLYEIASRRKDGCSAREMLRDDREWAVCLTCPNKHGNSYRHPLRGNNADHDYQDFAHRHQAKDGHVVMRIGPEYMEAMVRRFEAERSALHLSQGFLDNASVLEAFQAEQSLDLTGIAIASSVTAGWCSAWIDNHTNLYLDILFYYYMGAVNTAAGSQKAHYLFAPGAWNTTDTLPSNTAGNTVTNSASTSATLTYLDITANPTGFPQVAVVPYITTNKVISSGGLFGVAKGHDGYCPPFVWLGLVNAAGPTITATGSKIGYAGAYATVA